MSHVYLVGFMGAGKSTVGKLVSRRISRPFIDLDELIESRAGSTVSQIFAENGEEGFRSLETGTLESLMDSAPSVVACGGGVVLRSENRTTLSETGSVVYLKVSADQVLARVGDADTRPLIEEGSSEAAVSALLEYREAVYEAVSDAVIETDGRSIEDVARDVIKIVEQGVA